MWIRHSVFRGGYLKFYKHLPTGFRVLPNTTFKRPLTTSKNEKTTARQLTPLKNSNFPFNNGKVILPLILGSVIVGSYYNINRKKQQAFQEITWQEFKTSLLKNNLVSEMNVINNDCVRVVLKEKAKSVLVSPDTIYYFSIGSIDDFERKLEKAQDKLKIPDDQRIPVSYHSEGAMANLLLQFVPTLMLIGFFLYMGRKAMVGGQMSGFLNMGKTKARLLDKGEESVKIRFKHVAGADEAKEEIMEFVKFLQNPKKYEQLGAKLPKGAILSGPPGTGKTLLAKATAGEAGVPFLSVSGSEFVEMFIGVGSSRVRDLFKQAKEKAPCIIFIDEIDAIGKARGNNGQMNGGNDERESTLNQLLVEMDGFDATHHIVVLAGTNRPEILDPALLRPGRFDRHITIDKPDIEGRTQIFKVHLKSLKLDTQLLPATLAHTLARLTPGFTGADIHNICNEAAIIAARQDKDHIDITDFEAAIERVIAGIEKKTKVLSEEERKIIAYHEAGHAVTGWYLKYAEPLLKVSIIPRGSSALGYAQYLPKEQYLYSKMQLFDKMCVALGGRVAENLFFESETTGAQDDLQKVTSMAYNQVTAFGFNNKIGPMSFKEDDYHFKRLYSEKTGFIIDNEAREIVSKALDRTTKLLTEKKQEIEKVAQFLLQKEVLSENDMKLLLGNRIFEQS